MSTRLKGRQLRLTIGGVEYSDNTTACTITNEEADGDVTTFADAAAGGARKFLMNISAIQSTDSGSLWSYIWDNSGETVAYVYAPHANEDPTAAKPHFTGSVTIGPKPKIGGEAGATTFTFDVSWECTGEPTKVTSVPAPGGGE